MPIAAPLIGAAIGAGGSIYAANKANKGQQAAANASQQASNASIAEQRRQFDLARADQQPWLQTGTSALQELAQLYGLAPGGTAGAMSNFRASPDYQFRLNEQNRALTARNAALGIQNSGAAQKAALQYSGNLASGEFNNYANRLSALAGVGQSAAQSNAAAGQNLANAFTNIQGNNAQALGSSYQNQGAISGQLGQNLAGIVSGLFANNTKLNSFENGFGGKL